MKKYRVRSSYGLLFVLMLLITISLGCSKEEEKGPDTPSTENEVSPGISEVAEIKLNQVTDKEVEGVAISFVEDILNKRFENAYNDYEFTSEMKGAIDESALGQILIGTLMQYGDYVGPLTNYLVLTPDYSAVYVQLEFEKDKMAYQVSFDQDDKIAGFFFQEFVEVTDEMMEASNSDDNQEVVADVIEGAMYKETTFGLEEFKLPGTMSTTASSDTMVIMVHGSGPNDRDVTVGPNKVFKDIEQGLLKENLGSFRYDKRTFTHGATISGDETFGLYDETVEDCVLAVKHIKDLYGDKQKIVILGHSQGGHSIPYIAKELDKENIKVDGYIIMAGNYSPINELIEMQLEFLASIDDEYDAAEKAEVEKIVKGFDDLISGKTVDMSTPLFYVTAGYWQTFIDYKIAEDVKYIDKPTLVLNGSRDYQVPPSEVELWEDVLDPTITELHVIDGVNHLMIRGEGDPNPSEYYEPGHVDEEVINLIVDFLTRL